MSFGKADTPPPPDYAGAARAQGASNVQTAIAERIMDRPNEVTPLGSRTWSPVGSRTVGSNDPSLGPIDVPLYESRVNLTPLGQQRFDQEQRIIGNLGGIAESGLQRVDQAFSSPFSLRSADDVQNKAEEALLARLEPRLARDEEALRTRLGQQGFEIGSAGYGNEMRRFDEGRTDARLQAMLQALGTRPQTLQEELAVRNIPLNEINALRTGSQIQIPQFGNYGGQPIGPTPYMDAAKSQYGADLQNASARNASANAFQSGLFSLGGAALMGR